MSGPINASHHPLAIHAWRGVARQMGPCAPDSGAADRRLPSREGCGSEVRRRGEGRNRRPAPVAGLGRLAGTRSGVWILLMAEPDISRRGTTVPRPGYARE